MSPTSHLSSQSEQPIEPSLDPLGGFSTPAGFAAPAEFQSNQKELGELSTLADQVLQDPLLLSKLGDRIYQLLQEDLRYQQERSRNYGGRFP